MPSSLRYLKQLDQVPYQILLKRNHSIHSKIWVNFFLFTWFKEEFWSLLCVTYYCIPVQTDLAKEGVMVRHYEKAELKNYIRISVGKPEQTDAVIKALKLVS